jgi:acyl carrier protein
VSDAELTALTAEQTILNALRSLLERREEGEIEVTLDSAIYDDLLLDSLEIAEFSALLEDDLGSDPYTAGLVPRTVGEVVAFYAR